MVKNTLRRIAALLKGSSSKGKSTSARTMPFPHITYHINLQKMFHGEFRGCTIACNLGQHMGILPINGRILTAPKISCGLIIQHFR